MTATYYEILGVHSSAEQLVIRAAYRALAQRYHPDKLGPDEGQLAERMAQVNEAYRVLSDPALRKEYDESLKAATDPSSSGPSLDDLFDPPPPGVSFASADWEKACEYFPDLKWINERLYQTSWKLAWMYQSAMLETKRFNEREQLAKDFKKKFLEVYFGANSKIFTFAEEMVRLGYRDAVEETCEAIRVVGSQVDARIIINQVMERCDVAYSYELGYHKASDEELEKRERKTLRSLCTRFAAGETEEDQFLPERILDVIQGESRRVDGHSKRFRIELTFWSGRIKKIHAWDKTYEFSSRNELLSWISTHIVDRVLSGGKPGP